MTTRDIVMAAAGVTKVFKKPDALAVGTANGLIAYRWSSTGFGTKYTDPSSPTAALGSNFNPSFDAIGVNFDTYNGNSASLGIWPWNSSSGFGTQYSNPGGIYSIGKKTPVWSPNGAVVAFPLWSGTTKIAAYAWSSSGFGTRYADPSVAISENVIAIDFSPSGSALAYTYSAAGGSPTLSATSWSNSTGFGTKYTNPSTIPGSDAYSVCFAPANNAIAVSTQNSPYIVIYPWSDSAGFGSKYSNPSTLPTGWGRQTKFSPDGLSVAVAHDNSPGISVYRWSASGFGSKYSDPATSPGEGCTSVSFAPDSSAIAVGRGSSPAICAYPWSSSTGFGTKFTTSNPAISNVRTVSFG